MTDFVATRRAVLATAGALLTTGFSGLAGRVHAQNLAATPSMRGGANNYLPGAPIVERIGGGGSG